MADAEAPPAAIAKSEDERRAEIMAKLAEAQAARTKAAVRIRVHPSPPIFLSIISNDMLCTVARASNEERFHLCLASHCLHSSQTLQCIRLTTTITTRGTLHTTH